MRILFFIFCILCSQSCMFLGSRQNKWYKTIERIKPLDVIIVPGLPLYKGQWDTLLKARIIWSSFLYKRGITKNIIYSGNTETAIAVYNKKDSETKVDYYKEANGKKPSITEIQIITTELNKIQNHGKELAIEFEIDVPEKKDGVALSFQIMNSQQQAVIHNWISETLSDSILDQGRFRIKCLIPFLRLYQGAYSLNVYLGEDKGKEVFDFIQNVAHFEVTMTGLNPGHSFGWQNNSCIYREDHKWEVQKIEL